MDVDGEIDILTYKKIGEEVVAICNKYEYDIFYDLFNTKLNMEIKELANAPRDVKGKNNSTAHNIHVAAHVNNQDYQDWKFIEIVHFSMGYKTRIFLDKEEALKWLTECIPE